MWPQDWLHLPLRLVPKMGMAISCQVMAPAMSLWCRDGSLWLAEPGDGLVLMAFGEPGKGLAAPELSQASSPFKPRCPNGP